jgi:hypothetical protein
MSIGGIVRDIWGSYQLREEVAYSAVGDVGCESIEDERPCQGVRECFFQLVHFKMLVADSLLVDSDSLDGQDTVSRLQPPCVELVVRDDEEEDNSQGRGEASVDEENDLPRCNTR